MPISKMVINNIIVMCNLLFGSPDEEEFTKKEVECRIKLLQCYTDKDREVGTFESDCLKTVINYKHRY